LPFKGAMSRYSKNNKNYLATDNQETIVKCIQSINRDAKHIKTIILDDFQYTMSNEFMRRAKDRGYDKFVDIGTNAFSIINELKNCREDLLFFLLTHSDIDEHGREKCKTIGKLLDDKVTIEGVFSMVFHTVIINNEYKFLVQYEGNKIAKSPMGMFEEKYIPNDIEPIRKIIYDYFSDNNEPHL